MFLGCSPCCSQCVDFSLLPYTNLRLTGRFGFSHSQYSFWNSVTDSFHSHFPSFETSWDFNETIDLTNLDLPIAQPYGNLISKTVNSGTRPVRADGQGSTIETTFTLQVQVLTKTLFENGQAVRRTFNPASYGLFFRAAYDQNFPGAATTWQSASSRGNEVRWYFQPCGPNNDTPKNARLGLERQRDSFGIDDSITLNGYDIGEPATLFVTKASYFPAGTRRDPFSLMDGTTALSLVVDQRGYLSFVESQVGDVTGSRLSSMTITVDTFAFETDNGDLVPVSESWIDGPY